MDEYELLPKHVMEKASPRQREKGWKREDLEMVLPEACKVKLAAFAGQVQAQFPKATCDYYWLNHGPISKNINEIFQ